jgi:outer membrane protein assembly factor BamB
VRQRVFRRRLATVGLVALVLLAGTLESLPAAGRCGSPGYDDTCERGSLWVSSGMGAIWPSLYAHEERRLVTAGSEYSKAGLSTIVVKGFGMRTGRLRWSFTYDDPEHAAGIAKDAVLSRDGRTVFVTGLSQNQDRRSDWVTFALSAATGRLLWRHRFGGWRSDYPWQVVAAPHISAVYVAGEVRRRRTGHALVAYDASSGRRLWIRERSRPRYEEGLHAIEVRERDLYVLGRSDCYFEGCDPRVTLTRGRPSRSGFGRVWTRELPEDGPDFGTGSIEAGPGRVFLVGMDGAVGATEFVASAHRRRSGRRIWTTAFPVSGNPPTAFPVVTFDRFRHALVVGESTSGEIVALGARGRIRWQRTFPSGEPYERALYDLAADRHLVYATGWASDATFRDGAVVTAALAPRSGRQRWIARHAPENSFGVGGYVRFLGKKLVVPLEGFPQRGRNMWAGYVTYRRGE